MIKETKCFMRVLPTIMFMLLLLLPNVSQSSEKTVLYKNFFFGQSRIEIGQIGGVYPCGEPQPGSLCREGQPFASSLWLQSFSFLEKSLVQVTMLGEFEQNKYIKSMGVIVNNGFIPVGIQSGDRFFDYLAEARTRGTKAAVVALQEFESQALNAGHALYSFIPKSASSIARKSLSFADFVDKSPKGMRTVEMEVLDDSGGAWIAVRFFSAKSTQKIMEKQLMESKEAF